MAGAISDNRGDERFIAIGNFLSREGCTGSCTGTPRSWSDAGLIAVAVDNGNCDAREHTKNGSAKWGG